MVRRKGYTKLGNIWETNKLYKRSLNYNVKGFRGISCRLERDNVNISTSKWDSNV